MTSKAKLWAAVLAGSAATAAAACGGGTATTTGTTSGHTTGSTGSGGATSSSGGTGGGAATSSTGTGAGGSKTPGAKVFLILMENHNWMDIKGSASAPYINGLLAKGAHSEQYYNPPNNHPSEPNYLWLEAGTNFGIVADLPVSVDHQTTTAHLVTQLQNAGRTWKSYQEDISGTDCPLLGVANYAPKHDPMVFFDDVTDAMSPTSKNCISHVRPYTELAADLTSDTIADYNFLTPNLCDDMHDACAPTNDQIKQGDTWLSTEVPKLLASKAYQEGAVILITWDESELGEFPIGMIALGNSVKVGYADAAPPAGPATYKYTHSSTLRTVQEILGVSPFLGDAEKATDLSDLFTTFPAAK